jgi:hypothetical protein
MANENINHRLISHIGGSKTCANNFLGVSEYRNPPEKYTVSTATPRQKTVITHKISL